MRHLLIMLLVFHSMLCADHSDEESVIICGVCRNISQALDNSIRNIEQLGSRFADYAVVIYENNSSDDTAARLAAWAERNPHVAILSETLSSHKMSHCRTERIASARNKVLEQVKKKKYRKYKYLVMADLDFQSDWPIQEVVNSINQCFDWDCISANGVRGDGRYYDRYAFRSRDYPFGPELLGNEFWAALDPANPAHWFRLEETSWPSVYSAFGGLAIYKTETITQFSYSGTVTTSVKKYYEKILSTLDKNNHQLQLLGKKGSQGKLKFRKNSLTWQDSDDDSIAVCEHVALHASMALKGHGAFYINPKLIMRY